VRCVCLIGPDVLFLLQIAMLYLLEIGVNAELLLRMQWLDHCFVFPVTISHLLQTLGVSQFAAVDTWIVWSRTMLLILDALYCAL